MFQGGKPLNLTKRETNQFPSDGIWVGAGVLEDGIGPSRLPITLINTRLWPRLDFCLGTWLPRIDYICQLFSQLGMAMQPWLANGMEESLKGGVRPFLPPSSIPVPEMQTGG